MMPRSARFLDFMLGSLAPEELASVAAEERALILCGAATDITHTDPDGHWLDRQSARHDERDAIRLRREWLEHGAAGLPGPSSKQKSRRAKP